MFLVNARWFPLAALGAVLLAAAGGACYWAQSGLDQAHRLAKYELWPDVRHALARYVWLHPHDPQSQLLYAEALFKDAQWPKDQAATEALAHLRTIPDVTPEGALVRTQEGRVELFLLAHPTLAERLFRRAIELDPEMPEPYYLLWQVKDLTGRAVHGTRILEGIRGEYGPNEGDTAERLVYVPVLPGDRQHAHGQAHGHRSCNTERSHEGRASPAGSLH